MNGSFETIEMDGEEFIYNLINENKEQLYRIAFSYLHNEEEALEAIQETTFRAYKNRKRLKELTHAKTWIIRILINYCNDELKKRKKIIALWRKESVKEKDISTETVNNKLDIEFALQTLKVKHREVILLKYFEDFKIMEIAEVLDKPEGTIKTWLNKALKELRNILGEEGEYFE